MNINEQIKNILDSQTLDIRITKNARFMDQKVTPDVLCLVSDCILEFLDSSEKSEFSSLDIQDSDYTNENVVQIFSKPKTNSTKASNEYDKFFQQPLKMLSYAGILKEFKKGRTNYFSVKNQEILEYIAMKDRNALNFLTMYLESVLEQSSLSKVFEDFFIHNNSSNSFKELKDNYENFIMTHTSINKPTEPRRIFTKIINPLAFARKKRGTKGGNLSRDIITYGELMYNRLNWRDKANKDKKKGETRKEAEEKMNEVSREALNRYHITKAKRLIKKKYYPDSELSDQYAVGSAGHVHHIFMESQYPEIASYVENLILLTATQHNQYAHPDNNTRYIDKDYQYLCLIAKSESIKKSFDENEEFYNMEDYVFVLNTGLEKEVFESDMNFIKIQEILTYEYNKN